MEKLYTSQEIADQFRIKKHTVLDMLCSYIEAHPLDMPTLHSYMGSYNRPYTLIKCIWPLPISEIQQIISVTFFIYNIFFLEWKQ